jgi:ribosome maturation factor RimP
LEVSSPGLDRRLTKIDHYLQFLGEEVRVRLVSPQDGRRNFRGHLLTANEGFIEIKVDGEVYKLSIDTIDFTRLIPVFKNNFFPFFLILAWKSRSSEQNSFSL